MVTATIMEYMSPAKREVLKKTYSGRVSARLRELRESKKWLVDKLAAEINRHLTDSLKPVAKSTVHGWDNGSRKVDQDYIPAIASAFGLSVRGFMPKE